MAAILFNVAEPFRQIINTPFGRRPHMKSGKIGHSVSDKKPFKDNTTLYRHITKRQGYITTGGRGGGGWGGHFD